MPFTYDPTLPTQRDRVRLLYGDTDPAVPLLQDSELALVLAGGVMAQSSDLGAAVAAARIVLTKYVHTSVDITAGGTSVSLSQRVANLREVVIPSLQAQMASSASAVPYAGGLTWSDRNTRESDSDRVAPYFDRDGTPAASADWGR